MKSIVKQLLIIVLFTLFCSTQAMGSEPLTLDMAIHMALEKNQGVGITKSKVEEKKQKLKEMKSHYWPRIVAMGNGGYISNPVDFEIAAGSLGPPLQTSQGPMPIPPYDMSVSGSDEIFMNINAMVVQPLTQIIKINSGVEIANTDVKIAREELARVKGEIKYAVEKVYYGLLIAGRKEKEALLRIQLEEARLSDAQNAVASGMALPLDISGLNAEVLDKRKELLRIRNRVDNLSYMLNDLTGRTLETEVLLDDIITMPEAAEGFDHEEQLSSSRNHDLNIADLSQKKANLAVEAAQKEYLPDLNLFGMYNYACGIPIVNEHIGMVGLSLTWTIFDFGQKDSVLAQRHSIHKQAVKNYKRIKNEVQREIKKGYTNLKYSEQLIDLAVHTVKYRKDALKLATDLDESGLKLNTAKIEASANLAEAEADLFAAELSRRLELAKLAKLSGR